MWTRETTLASEKESQKELKVTDKRIFTADGEIKDEFKQEIRAVETNPTAAREPAPEASAETAQRSPESAPRRPEPARPGEQRGNEGRRRSTADMATNPGTPFANFIQSLVMQSYMFLGMLRDPRQPQPVFDAAAARETIDILTLLKEKTAGNLTPEEEDFFETHLGELKLAFVQRTKTI
jgi:hypothetical protein